MSKNEQVKQDAEAILKLLQRRQRLVDAAARPAPRSTEVTLSYAEIHSKLGLRRERAKRATDYLKVRGLIRGRRIWFRLTPKGKHRPQGTEMNEIRNAADRLQEATGISVAPCCDKDGEVRVSMSVSAENFWKLYVQLRGRGGE